MENLTIKEQIKAARKERKAAEKAQMNQLLLNRELTKLNNATKPLTQRQEQAKNVELVKSKISALESLDYKVKGYFGFNTLANKIISLVNTIQFNKHDMYEDALTLTGLSQYTIDEIVAAQGTRARVNLEMGLVEPGEPANAQDLIELLELAADELGCVFDGDFKGVTQEACNKIYTQNEEYMNEQLQISLKQQAE